MTNINIEKYWDGKSELQCFVFADGAREYSNAMDLLHREDGPAVELANGSKYWYINGNCHREDGPAVERWSGIKEWYIDDKKIECTTQEEFLKLMKMKAFW